MIEVNTTYLGQMPGGIIAKNSYAPVPAPLFRTQSEFILAWTNEGNASKYIFADIGISALLSAFSFTGSTSLLQV